MQPRPTIDDSCSSSSSDRLQFGNAELYHLIRHPRHLPRANFFGHGLLASISALWHSEFLFFLLQQHRSSTDTYLPPQRLFLGPRTPEERNSRHSPPCSIPAMPPSSKSSTLLPPMAKRSQSSTLVAMPKSHLPSTNTTTTRHEHPSRFENKGLFKLRSTTWKQAPATSHQPSHKRSWMLKRRQAADSNSGREGSSA